MATGPPRERERERVSERERGRDRVGGRRMQAGAAHSVAAGARRCLLALTPGRCRRAATRTTSPTATSAAGALLSLRCIRRCIGCCGGLTLPTTRARGYHAQGCHAHSESLARTGLTGSAGSWPSPGPGLGFRAGVALGSVSRRPHSAEKVPGGASSVLRGDGLRSAKCLP